MPCIKMSIHNAADIRVLTPMFRVKTEQFVQVTQTMDFPDRLTVEKGVPESRSCLVRFAAHCA
jgi:hypothetical protein